MVIIQKSYQELKQQYGDIAAREFLLGCYKQAGGQQIRNFKENAV